MLFLRLELTVSQRFVEIRERVEASKVAPEGTEKANVQKMTAIEEWKAVLHKMLESSFYAKVMIGVGILVNIVLVITESSWYAYYAVAEAEQDDASTE